jgi:hypothetical protein
MKVALEKLINIVIIPKYIDFYPKLNFSVHNTGRDWFDEKTHRYLVRFDYGRKSFPMELGNSLVTDTISLMQSLGFDDVKRSNNNMTYEGLIVDIVAKYID